MSSQLTSAQISASKPVLFLALIASGGSVATGVLAAVPEVPRWVLIVLALSTALGTTWGGILTGKRTVPWEDVAAKLTPAGRVIAGPAADQPTGARVTVVTDTPVPPATTWQEGDAL